jgi:hypothetical protein
LGKEGDGVEEEGHGKHGPGEKRAVGLHTFFAVVAGLLVREVPLCYRETSLLDYV